jgi:hypothetical protein
MNKNWLILASILIGSLFAGIYGLIHDLILVGRAGDYFLEHRFPAFGMHYETRLLVGAARIGFTQGALFGAPLTFILALLHTRVFDKGFTFLSQNLVAYLVAIACAAIGFAIGLNQFPQAILGGPEVIQINNYGYTGGFLGFLAMSMRGLWLWRKKALKTLS